MARQARKAWVTAKAKAGPAADNLKLRMISGQTLDAMEDLQDKVESQIAALNKTLAQYEIGLQKLDGIATVYGQKIKNEIKINARAKAALEPLMTATGDAFNMATGNTANFVNPPRMLPARRLRFTRPGRVFREVDLRRRIDTQ